MYYSKVTPIARSKIADEAGFLASHDLRLERNIAKNAPFLATYERCD
jgi:hypothetical protein